MNDVYFENVEKIGNLYLEHVFYEFESEPILFQCTDAKKKLYLCLCTEIRYGQKWIISECSLSVLKSLVREEMDITSAFLICPYVVMVTMDLQGNESSYIVDSDEIDRLDLPKEGTFLRCDKEKATEYLKNKERDVLPEILEQNFDTVLVIDKVPGSYDIVIEKLKLEILNSQIERYMRFVHKMYAEELSIQESAGQKMIEQEYCIHSKEKYIENSDGLDLMDNDCSLQAA